MAITMDPLTGFKPFVRSPRFRLQSSTHLTNYYYTNYMLQFFNQNIEKDVNQSIHRSLSTPCMSLVPKEFDDVTMTTASPRIEIVCGRMVPSVRALVAEVSISLCGVDPTPVSSGLGGAYFLCGPNNNIIAVAKPVDEEPMACNNPKGYAGSMLGLPGLKRSIRVGETAIRELAAYLLDHDQFAKVPVTAIVKFSCVTFNVNNDTNDQSNVSGPPINKIASLQRYVEHEFDAGELGFSGFSVTSVHRIGILDIRLLNLDRHAGNILVEKKCSSSNEELVPIDHGLCLPEWIDDPYFEWLHWPQALVPFSETEIEYINNLDPFKDVNLLRTELPCLIRESSLRVLVVCTIFLKRAVAAGLCLAEIGGMMSRVDDSKSALENVCQSAKSKIEKMYDKKSEPNDGTRSVSFSGQKYDDKNESRKDISFDEMGEEEWEMFVEDFDKLLPQVFEDTKAAAEVQVLA